MAHRVDTLMHAMQAPGREAVRNRARLDPEHAELRARDDAVLAGRERRDPAIQPTWAEFRTTVVANSARPLG